MIKWIRTSGLSIKISLYELYALDSGPHIYFPLQGLPQMESTEEIRGTPTSSRMCVRLSYIYNIRSIVGLTFPFHAGVAASGVPGGALSGDFGGLRHSRVRGYSAPPPPRRRHRILGLIEFGFQL